MNAEPQREPTLEESIAKVMQTLPPPIRHYLGQGKYSAVARQLMVRYGLRVDQGGVLERELMLMLMGIDSPEEFVNALQIEANLSQDVVQKITASVNEMVFTPLQEQMRGGGQPTQQAPTAPPAAQVAPRGGVASAPSYQARPPVPAPPPPPPAPGQPRKLVNLIPPPEPAPQPTRSAVTIPAAPRLATPPAPLRSAASSPMPRPAAPASVAPLPPKLAMPGSAPAARFAAPNRLLEDREEPHIEFAAQPAPPMPRMAPPTPSPSLPRSAPAVPPPSYAARPQPAAPPNLPGAMRPPASVFPPAPPPPSIPPNAPKPPPPPSSPRPANGLSAPSYGVDPYREPIDES